MVTKWVSCRISLQLGSISIALEAAKNKCDGAQETHDADLFAGEHAESDYCLTANMT